MRLWLVFSSKAPRGRPSAGFGVLVFVIVYVRAYLCSVVARGRFRSAWVADDLWMVVVSASYEFAALPSGACSYYYYSLLIPSLQVSYDRFDNVCSRSRASKCNNNINSPCNERLSEQQSSCSTHLGICSTIAAGSRPSVGL